MTKSKNIEAGFGALEIILSVALVAVIGVVGYRAWQNSHQVKTQTSIKSSPAATLSPSPATSTLLTIADWGVKLQLESSLSNTRVVYDKQISSDRPPQISYSFTTSRVEALGGNCANTTLQFGAIAILLRFSDKPVATPDGELINNSPIDGYYYVLTGPSASCSGLGVEPENPIETQDRAALKASLKSLSAIK